MCDKVPYLGFSILEYSKLIMYRFFYGELNNKMEDVKMLVFDTDGIIFSFKSDNYWKSMYKIRKDMDFSVYPEDHIMFKENNLNPE